MRSIEKAERRGLLSKEDLSPIQNFAMEIAMISAERKRQQEHFKQIKIAIVSSNPASAEKLFPEYFPSSSRETTEDYGEVLSGIDGPVMFEEMTGSDLEEVISMLGLQGQLSLGDLGNGD